MWQLLSAIAHTHQSGLFHRDIKPENLLLQLHNLNPPSATPAASSSSRPSSRPATSSAAYLTPTLKLADFGQARGIRSRPPYTEYVSTRWYRAPEQLLHSTTYSSPIDIWAAGCVMAELHTLTPLFAGNNEADTLQRIAHVIPPPTAWLDGQHATFRSIAVTAGRGAADSGSAGRNGLRRAVGGASEVALDLMAPMLQWEPKCRISAREALLHPFFDGLEQKAAGVEERKEVAGEDGEASLDSDTVHTDDAILRPSADGEWLTASNCFGELRFRHFPPPPHTGPATVEDKQQTHQLDEQRDEMRRMVQQEQRLATVTATGSNIIIASKLDWPSFSSDSEEDDKPLTTRYTHSNAVSASISITAEHQPSYTLTARQPAAAITPVSSATRSSAAAASILSLPAATLNRPPSVLSTHRTRRSFASVGSQMFTST